MLMICSDKRKKANADLIFKGSIFGFLGNGGHIFEGSIFGFLACPKISYTLKILINNFKNDFAHKTRFAENFFTQIWHGL